LDMNDKEKIVCPTCGGALKNGISYCSGCGTELSKEKDRAKGVRGGKSNAVVITGFVVLFGLLYLALAIKPEKATAGDTRRQQAAMPEDMGQYKAMLDQLPEEYDKLVLMGNKLMDEGSYHLAVEAYKKALAIDSTDPNVITDMGACYHALGSAEKAAQLFEKAVVLNPGHAIAYFNLGIVYRDLNNLEKTRQHWGRLIELYPDEPIADTVKKYLERLDIN